LEMEIGEKKKINRRKTKEAHLYQGRLHSVKGEYKKAIEEYKKALKIDPNYKLAKVNLDFISYMKLRPKGVLRSEVSPKGNETNVRRNV